MALAKSKIGFQLHCMHKPPKGKEQGKNRGGKRRCGIGRKGIKEKQNAAMKETNHSIDRRPSICLRTLSHVYIVRRVHISLQCVTCCASGI